MVIRYLYCVEVLGRSIFAASQVVGIANALYHILVVGIRWLHLVSNRHCETLVVATGASLASIVLQDTFELRIEKDRLVMRLVVLISLWTGCYASASSSWRTIALRVTIRAHGVAVVPVLVVSADGHGFLQWLHLHRWALGPLIIPLIRNTPTNLSL